MLEGCGREKFLTSWWLGSRETEKGQEQETVSKNMPPVTYSIQLDFKLLKFPVPPKTAPLVVKLAPS
jgi:hypothetical protein